MHERLLKKLQFIGITGKAWKWFEAYLRPCYQCVKTGDSYSGQCNFLSGVSQGSGVLGPLLFVIFINDLPECINSAIPFIFADDTKCLHIIRSTEDTKKLQVDTNNASNWSRLRRTCFSMNQKIFTFVFIIKLQQIFQLTP